MKVRKKLCSILLCVALAGVTPTRAQNNIDEVLGDGVRADLVPGGDPGRLYLPGAAAGMDSIFPGSYSKTFKLSANFRAGLSHSCGDLDFFNNIEAELKNLQYKLKETVKNAQKALMASASGAVSSLFQYALMKINPVLGQLVTKHLDEYIELFELKVKECRDFERDVANGMNPLSEIMHIAVGEQWKTTIGLVKEGKISLEEAEDELIEQARKNGVPMADGKSYGGVGQEPINITKSLLQSGMNLMLARPDKSSWDSDFGTSEQDIKDNPILGEFKSTKELYEFVEDIYGATEKMIGDSKAQPEFVKSVAGRGYEKKYVEYRDALIKDLRDYLKRDMDRVAFEKKTGIIIPPAEMNDLRLASPYQQAVEIESRAQQYAIERVRRNLIFAKQALKSGIYAPDLQQSAMKKPAEDEYKVLYYKIMDDIREIGQRAYQY